MAPQTAPRGTPPPVRPASPAATTIATVSYSSLSTARHLHCHLFEKSLVNQWRHAGRAAVIDKGEAHLDLLYRNSIRKCVVGRCRGDRRQRGPVQGRFP